MLRVSVLAFLLAGAACAGGEGYPYPSSLTDYFGEPTLVRASNWVRDGTSAAVYVREGETLPTAGLQVGVIVSYDKPEAAQLSSWLLYEAAGAAETDYQDGEGAEWCTIARNRSAERPRTYIALMVCHDGNDRAACVEADESFDLDEWASCRGTPGCFAAMCDDKWQQYGEELDWFIADILRTR